MSADNVKIEVYLHTSTSEYTIHIEKTDGLRCTELIEVRSRTNQANEVSVSVYERRPGRTPEL